MVLSCPYCRAKVADRGSSTCESCKRAITRHCPSCAEDISVLATVCKYCGEGIDPLPAPPVPAAPVRPEPVDVEFVEAAAAPKPEVEFVDAVRSVAWENPASGGVFRRSWRTWGSSQFSPAEFWNRMPAEGGHLRPIAYSWFLPAQVFMAAGALLFGVGGVAVLASGEAAGGLIFLAGLYGLLFPATFVATAFATWLTAALWHLPLRLLGARGGYEGTVRSVAYASGAQMWHLLPGVGSVIAFVMTLAGYYHAFRGVHGMTSGRAMIGAVLPALVSTAAVIAAAAFLACTRVGG